MSVILFAINTSLSHFYSTFWLSRQLKQKGHRIIYLGASDESVREEVKKYRDLVESRGFEFAELEFNELLSRKENDLFGRKDIFLFQMEVFQKLICEYKPDAVFLDAFLSDLAIILNKFNLRVVILQTMLCLDRGPFVPPINSNYIPKKKGLREYWQIQWEWRKLFFRRSLKNLLATIYLLGDDLNSQLRRIAKEGGLASGQIFRKRPFTIGIKKMPELLLSAKELDFERASTPDNYFFIGPMIDMAREEHSEPAFDSFFQSLSCRVYDKLVYCSLGTMATEHNDHCISFFQKVIDVFTNRPDDVLILSIGRIDKSRLVSKATNIHIFTSVPQIRVLKAANLMLTAAGINSITECMLLGVPIIVYPLNPEWDQNGNAARVVYHHIGVRGDLSGDTVAEIDRKLKFVLSDRKIKENVRRMQEVLVKKNVSPGSIDTVESLL